MTQPTCSVISLLSARRRRALALVRTGLEIDAREAGVLERQRFIERSGAGRRLTTRGEAMLRREGAVYKVGDQVRVAGGASDAALATITQVSRRLGYRLSSGDWHPAVDLELVAVGATS